MASWQQQSNYSCINIAHIIVTNIKKISITIYATGKGFIQASFISVPISAERGKKPDVLNRSFKEGK
jgi:hypothetical protein